MSDSKSEPTNYPGIALVRRMVFLALASAGLCAILAVSTAVLPQTIPACEAQPAAGCTVQTIHHDAIPCQDETVTHDGYWSYHAAQSIHHDGWWEYHAGYWVHHAGYWSWHNGYWAHHGGNWSWHNGYWSCDEWGCEWNDGWWEWSDPWDEWVDGWLEMIDAWDEWVDGWWEWHDPYDETVSGWWEWIPAWYETVCVGGSPAWDEYVEVCDTSTGACTGTCPLGGQLECTGSGTTCGAGVSCYCVGSGRPECNTASDCGGPVECPYSQQGGSSWTCQANQCVSVCNVEDSSGGDGSGGNNPLPTSTPTPPATATATRTPIPTPTPYLAPRCPPNPEGLGGSVTAVIPPSRAFVNLGSAPNNPVVVGQDPTKRGVDLSAQVQVYPCQVNWHYRVPEDYVWCGKETCNCAVDNCELRQRWKEWDETCSEDYGLAGVLIDGKLSADSVNWINGSLQQQYPGVQVYQGSIRFFPNPLAQQTNYAIGNPTIWGMAGIKYPLADPGDWDVSVAVQTDPTAHCGAQQWTIPFPKYLKVFFRGQTLIK